MSYSFRYERDRVADIMIFWALLRCCRRHQLFLHHAVYVRDVHQNVRGRISGILRLDVQPVRLRRHHLQLGRGGDGSLRGSGPDRRLRAQMRPSSARLQSHQVSRSVTPTLFSIFCHVRAAFECFDAVCCVDRLALRSWELLSVSV